MRPNVVNYSDQQGQKENLFYVLINFVLCGHHWKVPGHWFLISPVGCINNCCCLIAAEVPQALSQAFPLFPWKKTEPVFLPIIMFFNIFSFTHVELKWTMIHVLYRHVVSMPTWVTPKEIKCKPNFPLKTKGIFLSDFILAWFALSFWIACKTMWQ